MLILPEAGILFAGDTLEDPITYVAEPDRLEPIWRSRTASRVEFGRILPNHGAPEVIEGGGYGRGLLDATRRYVEKLLRCREQPDLAKQDLRAFVGDDLSAGNICYYAAYERVHRTNVERVSAPRDRVS